jgi:hypothetical protein
MAIYNADLIFQSTPISTELASKLTQELYLFLWAENPQYGINWELFPDDIIPVHILLINNELRLFLGHEEDLPEYTQKVSNSAVRKLNYDQCGSLVFEMLIQMILSQ